MKIGNLHFRHVLFLSPMSGITDYPFRRLVSEFGSGLVFTELVSADGLLRKGRPFLKIGIDEHPISVQLSGSHAETMARAAEIAEAAGADAVDINMGCPSRKVTDTGAGADLMRFPSLVEAILKKVRGRIRCPLTVKIRSGWDAQHINAIEIAQVAQDCGVDAITLHPRTRAQWFHGHADWGLIGELKQKVSLPVIGNGDVTTPYLANKMMEETGCDAVMIGKGSLGKPWIFDPENRWAIEGGTAIRPSLKERKRTIERHYELLRNYYDTPRAVKEIRRHIIWYTRGLPGSASFRSLILGVREEKVLRETIGSYFDSVRSMQGSDC